MARVKRGVTTHARHKKVLEQSKGFVGRSSTNYRIALERLEKSLQYAYRDRRVKKREFRGLWITRINAAVREHGITYSRFIDGLNKAGIERYGFDVTGRPGGPVLDGRAVFLAWFRRQDGVTMLVTDLSAPEKMQAFFYGRADGTEGAVTADLMTAYVAKMASYKAFGGGPVQSSPSAAGGRGPG